MDKRIGLLIVAVPLVVGLTVSFLFILPGEPSSTCRAYYQRAVEFAGKAGNPVKGAAAAQADALISLAYNAVYRNCQAE